MSESAQNQALMAKPLVLTPKPLLKVGQIVRYHAATEADTYNGTKIHPAIITRVWGDNCVNLKIFPDCGTISDRSSVPRAFHNGNSWGFEE